MDDREETVRAHDMATELANKIERGVFKGVPFSVVLLTLSVLMVRCALAEVVYSGLEPTREPDDEPSGMVQ